MQSEEAIKYQEDIHRSLKPRKPKCLSRGHVARIQVPQHDWSYYHNKRHHISDWASLSTCPPTGCLKCLCASLLPPISLTPNPNSKLLSLL